MASSSYSKNGNKPSSVGPQDIKILVVGEPGCGKTTFINKFYEWNKLNDSYEAENSTIYPIKYCMSNRTHNANIFDFNSFRGEDPSEALKNHKDANGFILMYAIDDPLSFEKVTEKWYANLEDVWTDEKPAILVGNKMDLRKDKQVEERLARVNKKPLTEENGQDLVRAKAKFGKYFDCSAAQNIKVIDAFEQILVWALADLENSPGVWL